MNSALLLRLLDAPDPQRAHRILETTGSLMNLSTGAPFNVALHCELATRVLARLRLAPREAGLFDPTRPTGSDMTTPELIEWLQTNDALVELLEAWDLELNFDAQNNRPWRNQVRVLLLRICEDVRALEDAVLAERMLDILLDERLLDLLVDHLEQASRKFANGGPIGWFLMLIRMFRTEVLLRLQIMNEFAIRQKHDFD